MQGQAHYLLWKSQDEFISFCSDHALNTILQEVEEAIYFGLIVNQRHVSHQQQNVYFLDSLTETKELTLLRYFRDFLSFRTSTKTREDISEEIVSQLKENNIPIDDCRAQGYDGGSDMSGRVKGLKSRILEKKKGCFITPCTAHSLNRVGVNSAKICPQFVTFFSNLESLKVFFSHSPDKWEILQEEIPLSVKRLSETRWSERVAAVSPVAKHYPRLLKAPDRVLQHKSKTLKPSVFNTVIGLKKYFPSSERGTRCGISYL